MTRPRLRLAAALLLVVGASVAAPVRGGAAAAAPPARLADAEFWQLVEDLSEPGGHFRSDNLLSNEIWFQRALGPLARMTRPGGAYLGVGPEQNFTYIAAMKPAVAFIVDVRRGNLNLQLMYKALFELSADRAGFVSRLFSREKPAGIDPRSTPGQLFEAFAGVGPTDEMYSRTMADIRRQLVGEHHFILSDEDFQDIGLVFHAFERMGPQIRYSPIGSFGGTIQPTYAELMAATDDTGAARSFLANESTFAVVRDLERRNLIVPVVGNFAGPKTIRAVGRYLRARRLRVSAFYLSNVEEYLVQDGAWNAFCANAAALPLDASSVFIRSMRATGPSGVGTAFVPQLRPIAVDVKDCAAVRP